MTTTIVTLTTIAIILAITATVFWIIFAIKRKNSTILENSVLEDLDNVRETAEGADATAGAAKGAADAATAEAVAAKATAEAAAAKAAEVEAAAAAEKAATATAKKRSDNAAQIDPMLGELERLCSERADLRRSKRDLESGLAPANSKVESTARAYTSAYNEKRSAEGILRTKELARQEADRKLTEAGENGASDDVKAALSIAVTEAEDAVAAARTDLKAKTSADFKAKKAWEGAQGELASLQEEINGIAKNIASVSARVAELVDKLLGLGASQSEIDAIVNSN